MSMFTCPTKYAQKACWKHPTPVCRSIEAISIKCMLRFGIATSECKDILPSDGETMKII